MIGREGALGALSVLGPSRSSVTAVVRVGGTASQISVSQFHAAYMRSSAISTRIPAAAFVWNSGLVTHNFEKGDRTRVLDDRARPESIRDRRQFDIAKNPGNQRDAQGKPLEGRHALITGGGTGIGRRDGVCHPAGPVGVSAPPAHRRYHRCVPARDQREPALWN